MVLKNNDYLCYMCTATAEKYVVLEITFTDGSTRNIGVNIVKNHYDILGNSIKKSFYSSPLIAIEGVAEIKCNGATVKGVK